jgi:hypothetical protein
VRDEITAINGSKSYQPAQYADYIWFARTDSAPRSDGIIDRMVPTSSPGFGMTLLLPWAGT